MALLLVLWGGLLLGGVPWEGQAQVSPVPDTVRADSLRGAPILTDSLTVPSIAPAGDASGEQADSAAADTTLIGTTERVDRYLPDRRAPRRLFEDVSPFLSPVDANGTGPEVELDSTGTYYRVDEEPVTGGPMRMSADAYAQERYRANNRENWASLIDQRDQQAEEGALGVSTTIPGAEGSAFATIFGKPEVDLRVDGQADINAGVQYSENEQQGARTGDATQIDPNFKQDLRLNVTGTIGDKLEVDVNWDTNQQFDFQNQVKLEYTGYEDEILQKVEAGNVYMETPSRLISGGQSLFGLKTRFRFGDLRLTTIASKQEGQSNSLSIEGGSETTEFDLEPTDYDEGRHFFLGYYFRNNWNRAHEDPTAITLFNGFDQVTNIEVWKLRTSPDPDDENVRKAAALVDLAESPRLVEKASEYTETVLPSSDRDQYDQNDLATLRDGDQAVSSYVSSELDTPLGSQGAVSGDFERLERGRDYRIDERLGVVSLQQRLRPDEALAVAFRYRAGGEVRTVGDFSGDQGGSSGGVEADRLVLKLLRPSNPVAPGPEASDADAGPAAWFLEMRNVYQLGGRDFNPEGFELNIEHEPPGQNAQPTIPGVGGQQTLLQMLGLDRVDQNGNQTPDNDFDFTRQTIDAGEGLLYFPYLQPFGERLAEAIGEEGGTTEAQSIPFRNLYRKKKENAEQEDQDKNVFAITGSFEGGSQGFYDLEAFTGIVEGSVEVTSGGQPLQEGTDYVVDYQSGTINITNQSFLADGRTINIEYEENSIADLQQKRLLGARADWSPGDRYSLGATMMRLSESSPVDKFRIGEEAIQNTIWGMNGSMELEPQWLTQAVDALPLVQTRAGSRLEISGEFAQLRPDHNTTDAFDRTVEDVADSERDSFAPDERNGVSYVDDFEGFENTFSLADQLSAWQVSAAPDSIARGGRLDGDVAGLEAHRARTHWRGSFGWYQLNREIKDRLRGKVVEPEDPDATRLVDVQEVFDRDTRGRANTTLRTLDVYFDPWERGPYNYTDNLAGFFRNPTQVWGGMTRQMPEGYTDFSVQNVEFVEFIVKVVPENGRITDGAKLFVDLGTISEDVVPNERLNTEDGLSTTFSESQLGAISRIAGGPSQDGSIDVRNGKTEDLGLDGLVSYTDENYDGRLLERNFYSDFVERADSLRDEIGTLGLTEPQRQRLRAEIARTQEDPSADLYHHYENDRYFTEDRFFPNGVTLQQRFSRYYAGFELNGFETQNELAEDVSVRRGLSRRPGSENLDGTGGNVEVSNDYFQYAIPLDELGQGGAGAPTDYVVGEVGEGDGWYKVRIPVEAPTRTVGNKEDFTRIESIRLWTTGHAAPVTMRFASFDVVGSQWRTADEVAEEPVEKEGNGVTREGDGEVRVASVNTEEDPNYESPVGAIVSETRTSRGVQRRDREQSLLLNVDQLGPGQQRAVSKSFNRGLDLLKYSNLRMYSHVHGTSNNPQEKERIRENLRLFVRIGSDESTDYYEYEQRLVPSNVPGTEGAESLWPRDNQINMLLTAFSQLKTARDQSGTPTDSTFTSNDVDLPLDFAPDPDGTTLTIEGTPSLNRINTVVIGVRNAAPAPTGDRLENMDLWVDELRVSGFDERSGWATNTSASVDLADLATIQGSFQRRTDGFGALESTLDERETSGNTSWSVRANVNLGSLLPKEQGWRIPVTMQLQSDRTTPRFDPDRGDIRVDEVQRQFDILEEDDIEARFGNQFPTRSPDRIREALKDSVRAASQTRTVRRTVTASLSKDNSDSWWMRQTVDALSLDFSYAEQAGQSPQRSVNDRWSWSGSFDYRLDFGSPQTVQPLGFLPDVPLLGALGDVDFNYVPTSLSIGGRVNREVRTRRSRPDPLAERARPARIGPSRFRENQRFSHQRTFNFQYNPFEFLSLSFDTNTRQSFEDAASRTQRNLIFADSTGRQTRMIADVDTSTVFGEEGLSRDSLGTEFFLEERLRPRSEFDVFQDLLFGNQSPHTNNHGQRFSASLQLGITDREALNWIDLRDISYQSSFNWRNSPRGSRRGATVSNSTTLRSGVSLRPNRVWERFGFFRRLKEAQREAEREDEDRDPKSSGDNEDDGDEGTLEQLPLPDPAGFFRRVALTVLDINNASLTYRGTRTARATNVGQPITENDSLVEAETSHGFFDALQGDGAPLGYRFGFGRSIDPQDKRVFPPGQNVRNDWSNEHQFEGRTTLSPSSALQVDLNWNVEWSRETSASLLTPPNDDGDIQRSMDERGSVGASVWAFGGYGDLVEQQLNTLRDNAGRTDTLDAGAAGLTNASVTDDFQDAYLMGGGSIGAHGFSPFPMPGWTVRYSGLSDWPLLRSVAQSVSLSHSYTADYRARFSSVSSAGEQTAVTLAGMDTPINYQRSEFEISASQVQKRYQPLIGLDFTWPGGLQTNLEWNQRTTTSLRTASMRVGERKTSELSGRLSYSTRGLDIPLLPLGRIDNRIRFSLTFTHQVNDEREFSLRTALEQAALANFDFDPGEAREGDNVSIVSETTRLTITPQVSYNVSNRVTADVRVEYENFDGDSRRPSFTDVNGSFNLQINISQN